MLVVAGAGTGKTMTLAHRVAHLVIEGVDTGRILLLTFTRRAAAEMTRRVESIVRCALAADRPQTLPAGVLPWSGTFHSVGNRLLRRFAFPLGLDMTVDDMLPAITLTWVAKSLLLRYGGLRAHRRALPLFLGLIVGAGTVSVVRSALSAIFGVPI